MGKNCCPVVNISISSMVWYIAFVFWFGTHVKSNLKIWWFSIYVLYSFTSFHAYSALFYQKQPARANWVIPIDLYNPGIKAKIHFYYF